MKHLSSAWSLVGFFTVLASIAAAKEGGVKNGGTGMDCLNDRSLKVLEEVIAADRGTKLSEIESWTEAEVESRIQERLASRPELRDRVLARYRAIGEAKSWEPRDVRDGKSDVSARDLAIWMIVHRIDLARDSEWKKALPEGCRLVTLSYFRAGEETVESNGGMPGRLTGSSPRILRLHEAVFMTGVNDYGHETAPRSQELVLLILAEKADETASTNSIDAFVSAKPESIE
ncbi:MAG: hypothetical protein JST04_06280 [Bdellovibrionales bacterium]|nr:hypothetical protein [Bdellovibrionales bacterium]